MPKRWSKATAKSWKFRRLPFWTAPDAEMYALAERYPQYGFDKHKGYGTTQHLEALQQYGALPEHRRDFAPVKALLVQGKLFE